MGYYMARIGQTKSNWGLKFPALKGYLACNFITNKDKLVMIISGKFLTEILSSDEENVWR